MSLDVRRWYWLREHAQRICVLMRAQADDGGTTGSGWMPSWEATCSLNGDRVRWMIVAEIVDWKSVCWVRGGAVPEYPILRDGACEHCLWFCDMDGGGRCA